MLKKIPKNKPRTLDQLKEHYIVERKLADRLRNAGKEERQFLYSAVYNELYQQIPHHPEIKRKKILNLKSRLLIVS